MLRECPGGVKGPLAIAPALEHGYGGWYNGMRCREKGGGGWLKCQTNSTRALGLSREHVAKSVGCKQVIVPLPHLLPTSDLTCM